MMKSLIFVVALCFAFTLALEDDDFTTLTSGLLTPGVIPAPIIPSLNYRLDRYRVWVPRHARDVSISFENTDSSACSYLHLYLGNTPPCAKDYPTSGESSDYVCDDAYDPGNGIGGAREETFEPSTDQDNFEWKTNSYFYVGIGRYSTYDDICTYTIQVTVNECADTDTVSIYDGISDSNVCIPYQNISVIPFAIPGLTLLSNVTFVGRMVVPNGIAAVVGSVNASTPNLNMYAASFGVPVPSNRYHCYVTTYEDFGADWYYYNLQCITPRAGEFYLFMYNDASSFETYTADFSIAYRTCPAGFGGWNCTDVVSAFDAETDVGRTFTLAPGAYRYFYVDFPAGSEDSLTLVASANDSTYFWVRHGGFPYDNTGSDGRGYETSWNYDSFSASPDTSKRVISEYETYVGGRWYFAVENDNSSPITFSLDANTTAPTGNGGDTTNDIPTDGEGSNTIPAGSNDTNVPDETSEDDDSSSSFAVIIVPSALVAVVAFLAAFF